MASHYNFENPLNHMSNGRVNALCVAPFENAEYSESCPCLPHEMNEKLHIFNHILSGKINS